MPTTTTEEGGSAGNDKDGGGTRDRQRRRWRRDKGPATTTMEEGQGTGNDDEGDEEGGGRVARVRAGRRLERRSPGTRHTARLSLTASLSCAQAVHRPPHYLCAP